MNRINNLREVRAELERLGTAADEALTGGLSTIERDILLDRLRSLYEAIRCLEPQAPASEKPVRADAPIDREIIDSLYGDGELPVQREEPPAELPAEDFSIDPASVPASRTSGSLREAIGLNDRLMLMNDLFDQDAGLYERTLDALDGTDNMDDAYIYLYEHFTLDDSKEGVKLLLSLIEQKFV